jgi:hypothetical protein
MIFVDEGEARKFCQEYLMLSCKPRLVTVMARNKYCAHKKLKQLTSGTQIHERKILRFDKAEQNSEDGFIRFLRQVEILAQAGFYHDTKDPEIIIQPDWMVVYITAYPLDEEDAADKLMERILERRRELRKQAAAAVVTKNERRMIAKNANPPPPTFLSRLSSLLETALHSSPCRDYRLLKLDVDTKDAKLLADLYQAMTGLTVVVAAETRGGYHVVIERTRGHGSGSCQALHQFVQAVQTGVQVQDHWITIESGNGPMIAIPGTNQGGFTVRLVTEQWQRAIVEQ